MGVESEIVLIGPSFIRLHLRESHAWQRAAGSNVDKVIFCDVFRVNLGSQDAVQNSDSSDSELEVQAETARSWGHRL